MPLSKALVQPFRKNTLLIGAGWRAFFAPYNIALGSSVASTSIGPAILDLATQGPFDTNNPPAGYFDLGWIKDFKLTPGSKVGQVRSGYRGAIRAQYRGEVAEQCEFKFRESTRMAFKIATGCEVFNLMKGTTLQTAGPLQASGAQAVPLHASGYQSAGIGTEVGNPCLLVPAGSGSLYAAQDYIVCDVDYSTTQYGVVGDAGMPVFQNAVTDVDFLRKTSDYVARVVRITANVIAGADALVLSGPLVGGGSGNPTARTFPPNTAKIQKIKGYASREGGSFISEWSGLFICDTVDSDQIAVWYPHISIAQFKDVNNFAIENVGTTELTGYELDAIFNALAYDDPEDGETVVCYRAFYPAPGQDIAI